MVLVDYPDSSSDGEHDESSPKISPGGKKRKAEDSEIARSRPQPPPPPLPPSFHSLYATSARSSTVDDPTLHGGRTRQIPHVVGNWPTHIYLEWYPSKDELILLDHVIEKAGQFIRKQNTSLKGIVHSFLHSELGAQLPLHISLSAPLVLKTEQKDPFRDSIGRKVAQSHVKSFVVGMTSLDWVANHDGSRFFLVLKLTRPENDELNKLLSLCNESAQQLGLPSLYNDSSNKLSEGRSGARIRPVVSDRSDAFHISIAWTLEEPNQQARGHLVDLERDRLQALQVSFSLLKLKIGNVANDIPLSEVGNQ